MLDHHGSINETDWTLIAGQPHGLDPNRVVLENGLVRIAHPPGSDGEKAGHVLYVKLGDKWELAGDLQFGDWTYVGSSFKDSLTRFEVLQNTDAVARIQLTFANHVHEFMGNAPLPVSKTLVLHRGAPGYRVIVDVPNPLPGEREVGFGGTRTHLFSYSGKFGVLWNPYRPPTAEPTDYEWVRDEGQTSGDWWAASLAFNQSYYRLVSVRESHRGGLRTGQFAGGNTGHLIHWAFSGMSRYEAFVAALPYDGRMARRVTVRKGLATVTVPEDGTYSLYARAVIGRRYTYIPAKTGLQLKAGSNTVSIKAVPIRAGIVVPVGNGVDFPEDISLRYRAGQFD
jgi:hypothetical protein